MNEFKRLLKTGQVLLLQSQLQFERHRREIHAERNRRLLAKLKGLRLVEEEMHTLRLQLAHDNTEMTALRRDVDSFRRQRNAAENDRSKMSAQLEASVKDMIKEIEDLKAIKNQRDEELASVREEARYLKRDADKLSARLFETEAEMAELRRRANDSRRYQQELKEAQYNLIAARETANLLQQQVASLPSPAGAKFEIEEFTRCYRGKKRKRGRGTRLPIRIGILRFRFDGYRYCVICAVPGAGRSSASQVNSRTLVLLLLLFLVAQMR